MILELIQKKMKYIFLWSFHYLKHLFFLFFSPCDILLVLDIYHGKQITNKVLRKVMPLMLPTTIQLIYFYILFKNFWSLICYFQVIISYFHFRFWKFNMYCESMKRTPITLPLKISNINDISLCNGNIMPLKKNGNFYKPQ